MRTLCLGEALVDLVCEAPVADVAQATSFAPHPGGAHANVAVAAARLGADIALAGGAGDDAWGRWLAARLDDEGVDLDWFRLVDGVQTPVAFVTVDHAGEPSYAIYGNGINGAMAAIGHRLDGAVEATDALFFGSNTLVGEAERAQTLAARDRALALGRPVVFDPNLRLHRWPSAAEAAAVARECVPGCFLVRCNEEEAVALTGESQPAAAAQALIAAGARLAVVSLGADGALMRGELSADVAGVPARVRSTVGAGDVLTGTLLARLSLADFYPPAAAAALPEAVALAARATESWGAQGTDAGRVTDLPTKVAKADWRPPSARRVRTLRDRLRAVYGIPRMESHGDPMGELVLTVLSQSTNDRNRDVAFGRLRERFGSGPALWEAVRDAPLEEVEEAIRPGGISKVKSARIQAILRAIGEPLDLEWMRTAPVAESRAALCELPGVGRKTAACVLLFAFGVRDIPVDTHVSRVATRLGLLRPGAGLDPELHDAMLALTPAEEELELHVNLLRHGRRTCHAQRPACDTCALRRICPSRRG